MVHSGWWPACLMNCVMRFSPGSDITPCDLSPGECCDICIHSHCHTIWTEKPVVSPLISKGARPAWARYSTTWCSIYFPLLPSSHSLPSSCWASMNRTSPSSLSQLWPSISHSPYWWLTGACISGMRWMPMNRKRTVMQSMACSIKRQLNNLTTKNMSWKIGRAHVWTPVTD